MQHYIYIDRRYRIDLTKRGISGDAFPIQTFDYGENE